MNILKTFLICMVAGVVAAVAISLVFMITNGLNITDFTNQQLSGWAKDGFIAGFVVCVIYSLATKRQW